MTLVGCDLHSRDQQVAVLDTATGEVQERRLVHDGDTVEHFYTSLTGPVTVGIESTGYALWFHALLQRLGHEVVGGDAPQIRAMVVRKTKTDRRDAAHLLDILHRLALGPSLFTRSGVSQLQALSLPPHTSRRRSESLDLLAG